MDLALDLGCILVGMAREAQGRWSGRDQLDVGNVFDGPNLVATVAAHRHGRMDRLALGLVFVEATQVDGSAFGSSATGCLAAETRPAQARTRRRQLNPWSVRLAPGFPTDMMR